MRKIICVILILICLCSFTACATKQEAEANLTPEPFELVIYEEDNFGYVYHKVLYNKETKVYHEYRYYYNYEPGSGSGYRNLDYIEFIVYDKNGIVISTEVQG